VRAEDLQGYLSSTFSSVLNSPVIHDLLVKLGPQSGLELPLDEWRTISEGFAEKYTHDILHDAGQSDNSGDNLSEMMQQMMPVVSQVLAGFPPFESALQHQHNDDGNSGGELDSSLQVIKPFLILFCFNF
jgi:hypothetical protein